MQRYFLTFAALSGFLAVALGAFAAHVLKNQLSAESLSTFHTGVNYQMYHALALFALGVLIKQQPNTSGLTLSGLAFILGSLLFSGSLYAIALGAPHIFGIITPVGGLCFLIGWLSLAYASLRLY